ncbi:hypothetical protein Syn6312_2804 [Synechococcus sp. PCC 6312]|nr:hypothetical protein Syn6312_2804 [Synechococcus sp. PCC 6312]
MPQNLSKEELSAILEDVEYLYSNYLITIEEYDWFLEQLD